MARTETEKIEEFQKFMTDEYFRWAREVGLKDANESNFANKYLHVSAASFNAWIRGLRVPNYENTIKMALALGARKGAELFDILEYPPVVALDDPDLKLIFELWHDDIPGDAKKAVKELITDYLEGDNGIQGEYDTMQKTLTLRIAGA